MLTEVDKSSVVDDCFSPRSLFDPEVELQEDPHLQEKVDLDNSFVNELNDEKSKAKKRNANANKGDKPEKKRKTNLETIVKLFKDSEESQQNFFREMIENQRKIDAEEKARDQAFFLEIAKIMKDN